MKRDMSLIRRILFKIEEMDSGSLNAAEFDDINPKLVEHHFRLLDDMGFLLPISRPSRSTAYNPNPNYSRVRRTSAGCFIIEPQLSSEGHDFLDAIRDDNVWTKVKTKLSDTVSSTSTAIIKALATKLTKEILGL